jgi:N utilization substance protein A
MSTNIGSILSNLANVKQLDAKALQEIIKESIHSALSKKMVPENDLEVIADFESGDFYIRLKKIVVMTDNNFGEISLAQARATYGNHVDLGDSYETVIPIGDLEPKIVKIARKAILEKIHELEEDRIRFDYEKQKNTIVSGVVKRVDYNGIVVNIGYTEALLATDQQIEEEFFKVGDVIRAYVVNILQRRSGVQVILSRTNPEFVNKLFELEVPEIYKGDVEILKIVREPGIRSKIEVISHNPKIDPYGACLGEKGNRIDQVRKELHGEQIDIIVHDENSEEMIANAVGEDLVERIIVAERGKFASVIVSEKNKNLAIGKNGKNVKLAAKLTGFKLDIYTFEEYEEKLSSERRITSYVTELDGVTENLGKILREHGYTAVQDIYNATVEELCRLEGIGERTAEKLIEAARSF